MSASRPVMRSLLLALLLVGLSGALMGGLGRPGPNPVAAARVSSGSPSPSTAPASAPVQGSSAQREAPLAGEASVPVRVRIPSLGVNSSLVELGLDPDGVMEVPSGAFPAGWFSGAPTPGERGPAVIAGHVDWRGEPGVFQRLGTLETGSRIEVERADGLLAVFEVVQVENHDKDRFPTEAVYGNLDHAGLRLITCGGRFERSTRSYTQNVVVFADLVSLAPSS